MKTIWNFTGPNFLFFFKSNEWKGSALKLKSKTESPPFIVKFQNKRLNSGKIHTIICRCGVSLRQGAMQKGEFQAATGSLIFIQFIK